jgi:molybdopterin-guanine dinucleotide biosynthesis protein A
MQATIKQPASIIINAMLTVAIQAGGDSRRMGQDKALIPFLGEPLIQRVVRRVAMLADEILVTTNKPEAFGFLQVPLVADILPGNGALGGLYTALYAASHPLVAVVACDMPFVNPQILSAARCLLEESGADVAIARTEDGFEPFHAVYRRETCLPQVKAALDSSKRHVDAWFSWVKIHYLEPAEILPYDPDRLAFLNVNTPEELRNAERTARMKGSG